MLVFALKSAHPDRFLLPRLHINHLKQQINMRQLQKATRMLSADISQSISIAMDRIQAQVAPLRDIGIRVLFWVLRAMRPLRIEELRHALAVELDDDEVTHDELLDDEFEDDDFTDEGLVPQDLIISSCAGLVSIDDQTRTIRLIHLSVKQHLENIEDLWFPQVHLSVARTCIKYVPNDAFLNNLNIEQEMLEKWLTKYPFLAYSLEYWGHHACLAPASHVLDEIIRMIMHNDRANFLFRGLYLVLWKILKPCANQIPGSFLAAYFGLVGVSTALFAKGEKCDKQDSLGRTALFIAAAMGQVEIVKTLIDLDADVSGRGESKARGHNSAWWLPPWARDDNISHALCVAAESGHREVVQLLIDKKANTSAIGSFHDGALEAATFWGHTEIAKLLLRHGAPITRNTLQSSAYSGRVDILEVFLGFLAPKVPFIASIKLPSIAGVQDLPKALYAAALVGRTPYAERLLKYGVDPNEKSNTSYRTPLQAAASQGHIEMMRLLLCYGAVIDFTAEGEQPTSIPAIVYDNKDTPGTALQAAAFAGQIEAVKLLLEAGASVNLESGYYGTALQAAAAGGHSKIFDLILGYGALVNTQCGFYGNPLQAAASKGSLEIVQALLNAGAEVNTTSGVFGHALQAAAWSGNNDLFRLLVGAGANLHAQGGIFGNALQAAAVGCPIVETILRFPIPKATTLPNEFQSYIDRSADRRWATNVMASWSLIHGSMMKAAGRSILKDLKASARTLRGVEQRVLKTKEGEAREALLDSPEKSLENTEVVRQLLNAGISPNVTGGKHHTALQAACYSGHLEIVNLLLERGADLHVSYDQNDLLPLPQDALAKAIDSGHTVIVKRLLEKGANTNGYSAKTKVSALFRAIECANVDITRMLIDQGAEVNAFDEYGITPLWKAVSKNDTKIVTLLIQQGADVNMPLSRGQNLLELSAVVRKLLEMTTILVGAGVDTESIDASFPKFLLADSWSRSNWNPERKAILGLLLDHGAHCNVGSFLDRTLVTKWLQIKNEYTPSFTSGLNPLSVAASQIGNYVEPVEMLVRAGADLQRYGADALWLAVRYGHARIVRHLIQQGVEGEKADMEMLNSVLNMPEKDNLAFEKIMHL